MLLLKYKKNLKLEIKLRSPRKLRGCIISCLQHPSLQVDSLALELHSSTPGLDRWCMSSGIKLKFLSHLNTPRTKLVAEAEGHSWGQGKFPCQQMLTKAPWGSKKEGYHTIKSLDMSSQASAVGSILAESYTCVLGRVLGLVRCEKETQHNWPKVNKDPEDLSYIRDLSHLFTVLLLIREDSHTLSLWVCISA